MKPVKLLSLIAIGGALLAAGCFGGAYSLANVGDSRSMDTITREVPWDGSGAMTLEVPAVMRYVQAPGPGKIVARGPHRSVSTLTVTGGHIHDTLLRTGAMLEITLFAPAVTNFHVNGYSQLTIEDYDQAILTVSTEGAAAIEANGKAQAVAVHAGGDGTINLARIEAASLTANIDNAAVLVAAPSKSAKLAVANFGTAILLTRPADLVTNLNDDGRVIDASKPS